MSIRASLTDLARLKQHGYTIERWTGTGGGWMLLDHHDPDIWPDGAQLMIGEHGGIAPTQWEAVAEGLSRIEQDERCDPRATLRLIQQELDAPEWSPNTLDAIAAIMRARA